MEKGQKDRGWSLQRAVLQLNSLPEYVTTLVLTLRTFFAPHSLRTERNCGGRRDGVHEQRSTLPAQVGAG